MKAVPLFLGASCDSFRRSLPAHPLPPRRLPPPKPAFSSSPIRPTAMASTSASPRATDAVPTRPVPIANHAILRRPRPIAASILMRLPGRCRKQALLEAAAACQLRKNALTAGYAQETVGETIGEIIDRSPLPTIFGPTI